MACLQAGWVDALVGREGRVVVGYLCVTMELTEVDKRSNDCGDVARGVAALAKRVAGVFGCKCRSFCVRPSPGREVLIGPSYAAVRVQGTFQL